jgi:hypothetical protein
MALILKVDVLNAAVVFVGYIKQFTALDIFPKLKTCVPTWFIIDKSFKIAPLFDTSGCDGAKNVA